MNNFFTANAAVDNISFSSYERMKLLLFNRCDASENFDIFAIGGRLALVLITITLG